MKTDLQMKQDVDDELRWDPKVNAAHIGVTVEKGAVTLQGTVDTYAEKWCAEDAARRVSGVTTIAEELTVKLLSAHAQSDTDIAVAARSALRWDVFVPSGITAEVERGTITLRGHATWNYQRDAAERAVRQLKGVITVYNSVSIKPEASATQVKERVGAALDRQAASDTKGIEVDTSGGKVTLKGHVASWQSSKDALAAAWSAPGVTEVIDEVRISAT